MKNDSLKLKIMLKKIGLVILAIVVILQFFRIDKENPKVIPRKDFITQTNPPEEVKKLITTSCYDCHSNTTKYPWYSNVAPISWWLADHIEEGREELNFSEWADYSLKKKIHKMEECWEMIEEGEMPLESYLITHGDAVLTADEKELLIEWFKSIETSLKNGNTGEEKSTAEKVQINQEVTAIVDEVLALLKEHKTETDIAKLNAIGENIENKLAAIGDVFNGEREVLDQFNKLHGESIYKAPTIKSTENVEEAHSVMLAIEENLSSYHNNFESNKTLVLDGSQKWQANIETTNGIEKMLSIVSEEVEAGRVSHYAAMGERLNIELKTIFSSCTMKGEAHEQLHVFIMPLVDLCEKLESAETEDEALVLQKDILKQLNLYTQYFN